MSKLGEFDRVGWGAERDGLVPAGEGGLAGFPPVLDALDRVGVAGRGDVEGAREELGGLLQFDDLCPSMVRVAPLVSGPVLASRRASSLLAWVNVASWASLPLSADVFSHVP